MDAESLYSVLRSGSPDERRALLDALPATGFEEAAAPLIGSDRPGTVVLAVVSVVMPLCNGQGPAEGKALALAAHRFAVELFEGQPDHAGLLPMTLSNLAHQYVHACNLLSDSEEALAFTERWIPYYERLGERENVPGLKAGRINALLNLQRLDDAAEALQDPTLRGNFATDIEIARLERLLAQLRGAITADKRVVAAAAAARAEGAPAVPDEIRRALFGALDMVVDDPGKKSQLANALSNRLDTSAPSDLSDPAVFEQFLKGLGEAERYMTRGAVGDNEITIRGRIRAATGVFITSRPSPEQLRESLAVLEQCLEWTQQKRHAELMNDALWGIYLCQSRLNQPSKAADALLGLRKNLEAARASIADPLKRGGVFSQYPHLFAALCTQLHKAGRTDALLEAIEASKGRGVADILTRKAGIAVSDATVYAAAEQLPALTREHNFHYLTFFVDEHETYAALVTKIGDVLAVPHIALGQAAIREAATQADPRQWDTRWGDNTASILSPLVEWLEDLMVEGVIEEDDHLCYAADEDLSNVPLQYLPVAGRPLIETVSLSRIHGAALLAHVLAADAAPPARFHGFLAPTRQNREHPSWSELQRYLRQPIAWLANHLEGNAVEEADASLEHVAGMDLRRQILHFSAHGTFPQHEADGTPFEHSGIILGSRGQLADEERLQARDLSGVLTPRRVLDAGLDLTNSHVSLMSCVSGLSREGLGGDALGIEWALLQAGAQSLLAAHWNIDARVAAAFFERYYQHWLGEGTTRAQALRLTMHEFRDQPEPFSRSESWAAFSLTGDWR